MGLGTRFDPGVIGTPLSVVGGLLDELVGALAKSAKGCSKMHARAHRTVDRERAAPAAARCVYVPSLLS